MASLPHRDFFFGVEMRQIINKVRKCLLITCHMVLKPIKAFGSVSLMGHLYRMIKKGLFKKVTFEEKHEKSKVF